MGVSLLNRRLKAAIMFYDVLHRLRAGRGTGTASLETNLLQQLTVMREVVLSEVFLEIQKANGALDWDMCLVIIAACGVGPRTIRILQTYWGRLTMGDRAGGYFGRPFKGYRGVAQGDPLNPRIFNMVVDAVIRHWAEEVAPNKDGTKGLPLLRQPIRIGYGRHSTSSLASLTLSASG